MADWIAPLEALAADCAALDPPLVVSLDPADINPSVVGGWLALDEVRPHTLTRALELRCSLYLITQDVGPRLALAQLHAAYDRLVPEVLTPDGPVVPQGVVLPGDGTPLPALRVPVYLYTESE